MLPLSLSIYKCLRIPKPDASDVDARTMPHLRQQHNEGWGSRKIDVYFYISKIVCKFTTNINKNKEIVIIGRLVSKTR